MTHALKTWPEYFKEVQSGKKTFEVRKNDREFKEGDRVLLQEYDIVNEKYTGKELEFRIGYILNGVGSEFGIKKGYCVFTLERIEN